MLQHAQQYWVNNTIQERKITQDKYYKHFIKIQTG